MRFSPVTDSEGTTVKRNKTKRFLDRCEASLVTGCSGDRSCPHPSDGHMSKSHTIKETKGNPQMYKLKKGSPLRLYSCVGYKTKATIEYKNK